MPVPTIRLADTENLKPTEVTVEVPQKRTHFGAVLVLLITFIFLGASAFGAGWLAFQVQQKLAKAPSEISGEKAATDSGKVAGWTAYADKINQFSLYYPPTWKAQAHDVKDSAGVLLSSEDSSVELWLTIDKAVGLSDEQKAGLKSSETKSVQLDGRPAIVTTNEYQAGNFLNTIVFPATLTKAQVTFWLTAVDKDTLDTEMKMVASFKFD